VSGPISIVKEPPGRLTITTGSTPSACRIRDWKLTTVAEGVTPLTVEVPPGFYAVSAAPPHGDRVSEIVEVKAGEPISRDLSKKQQSGSSTASYGSKVLDLWTKWKGEAFCEEDDSTLPAGREVPIAVRFLSVPDWDRVEPLTDVPIKSTFSNGLFSLDIKTPDKPILFVQVATADCTPINIALPVHGLRRPSSCLVVSVDEDAIETELRLKDRWSSVVADYLQNGRLAAVRELVTDRLAKTNLLDVCMAPLTNPVAYNLLPSLLLRFTDKEFATAMFSRAKDLQLHALEYFHWADIHLFLGELAAQRGDKAEALKHFLNIRAQDVPIFTASLSKLTSRMRQYCTGDKTEGADSERATKLLARLMRWAPFLDTDALTLTFPAANVLEPAQSQHPVKLDAADGWTVIPPKSQ
jgi:hypothetical protein